MINVLEDDLIIVEFLNYGDYVISENEVIVGSGILRKVIRFVYFFGNLWWNF